MVCLEQCYTASLTLGVTVSAVKKGLEILAKTK